MSCSSACKIGLVLLALVAAAAADELACQRSSSIKGLQKSNVFSANRRANVTSSAYIKFLDKPEESYLPLKLDFVDYFVYNVQQQKRSILQLHHDCGLVDFFVEEARERPKLILQAYMVDLFVRVETVFMDSLVYTCTTKQGSNTKLAVLEDFNYLFTRRGGPLVIDCYDKTQKDGAQPDKVVAQIVFDDLQLKLDARSYF